MKGKKHRETGGRNDAAEDLDKKTPMRVNAPKIEAEADERASGGRTGRKRGGVVHHENMEGMKHAKHVGAVQGSMHTHAGRKPRKDGGRTGSDSAPFSSARKSTPAPGRKVETGLE